MLYRSLFFLSFLLPFLVVAQGGDRFAEIGNKASATRLHLLETKLPATLPNIFLPVIETSKGFKPMNRLDTPEELGEALKEARKIYEPFLKNNAPAIDSKRESIFLKEARWRKELPGDKISFSNILQTGVWEKIILPHYGPPLGMAATYYASSVSVTNQMIQKGAVFICFKAVDYKAHVFINGSYVGSHEGAFAPFEFNITDFVFEGINQLLIKVENDYPMQGHVDDHGKKLDGDKVYASTGLGYDEPNLGWHHNPPGMGIWQDAKLEARATLHVNDIFVRPIGQTDTAEIWIEVNNTKPEYKEIKLRHSLYGRNFKDTVYHYQTYEPNTVQVPGIGDLVKPTDWERKKLKMGKGVNFLRFRVHIPGARRWSPDHPWLYQLQVELLNDENKVLDVGEQHFGMRSFYMDTLSVPKGAMYLNGNFIRLRGANTMGSFAQAVKQKNWQQLTDDILLAKIANMNYIRLTQFPLQPEVYDYFDMLGMMTQTDLPLFGVLRRNKWAECVRQAEEMERLIRSHPSNVMVTYINERFPNAEGAPQRHFDTYEDFEKFFTAADQAILLNNPDRVIKAGDGDYDPPSPGLPDNHVYNGWYNGHGLGLGEMYRGYWLPVKPGWYYACGEFGSEGLDFYNTMYKYYPKNWLPQNTSVEKDWTPNLISQAQTYRFHYMWFNRQHSVKEWIKESQDHQAWVTKLTTESFRRNNSMVSFAIHLFIDAWPAGWMKSIMDVQRQPKKAYFEYAHALAPLAVSLRSDRNSFFPGEQMSIEAWIASDHDLAPSDYSLRYQWEKENNILAGGKITAKLLADSSQFQGYINMTAPAVKIRTEFRLRLQLQNERGEAVHETDFIVTVFPKEKREKKKVFIVGTDDSPSLKLLSELSITPTKDISLADMILVDSMPQYIEEKTSFDEWVKNGKRLIFLQPSAGNYLIGNDSIKVFNTVMGQYYFVSPVISHETMKGFQPKDFFFWYNENTGTVRPILGQMFQGTGWNPLLLTGQTGWVGENDVAYAAAEKKFGKGTFLINHVQLTGRVRLNPVAYRYAMLLFQ